MPGAEPRRSPRRRSGEGIGTHRRRISVRTDHLDRLGERDVAQALWAARMHAGADHATRWAVSLGGSYDVDPSLSESENLSFGDAIIGQVGNSGGSIGVGGSRLDQGS